MSNSNSCLITGGNGFIGSHMVMSMALRGWRVRVLDHGSRIVAKGSSESIQGDFRNVETLRRALKGMHTVLHFASATSPATAHGKNILDVKDNLIGTVQLLEESLRAGVNQVVFPSSGGTVYGPAAPVPTSEIAACRPISSHGIVKRAIESYIEMFGLEQNLTYKILRYSNPYGPGQDPERPQGVVAVFAKRIMTGQPIDLWGDGNAQRDFIYIDDLVEATIRAITSDGAADQILNIGSGKGISILEAAAGIERACGRKAQIVFHAARSFDVPRSVLDISQARKLLDWSPTVAFEQGISRTIAWLGDSDQSVAAASQVGVEAGVGAFDITNNF